jgi:uncharacterized NAD(P)/FAD-binding protein YdhS
MIRAGRRLAVAFSIGSRRVPQDAARHVIVVGGGASGVLLASQLLSGRAADLRVTIVEKRPELGRGIAYCTTNPAHLLNVRAANMSALPDDPDHFLRWLEAHVEKSAGDEASRADPFSFVPRRIYGDYLAGLIEPILSDGSRRLRIVQGECVWIGESGTGIAVVLANGCRLTGHVAVCATGHDTASMPAGCYAEPWVPPGDVGISGEATVLILGTGLTMIDYALSLLLGGHRGPVVAMSRRGLVSRAHRRVQPTPIAAADVPFGAEIAALFRWFRRLAEAEMARGGDWRSVVDGIRPFTHEIWRRLSPRSKHRFLEHARAWWDVHRHRMAPEVEQRIAGAIAEGALIIVAGKISAVEANPHGALVRYRRRGESIERTLQIAKIMECTGIVRNPSRTANPALRSLLDQGLAQVDPLEIGIEVTAQCALVDQFGVPSERLFAIGPLTRAAFWEVIAIPDIRAQCAALAAHLQVVLASGERLRACDALAL